MPIVNSNITLVSQLIDCDTKKWNTNMLHSMFDTSLVNEILNIRLYLTDMGTLKKDKLRWVLTNNGEFTVKSLYAKLHNQTDVTSIKTNKFWKKLLNMNTSQRIKLFIWKCLQDTLPTKKEARSSHGRRKEMCFLQTKGRNNFSFIL